MPSFGNTEILQVAEVVAREKSIPKETIIEAMEEAIKAAAKRKYGYDQSIRVLIDRNSGTVKIFREMLVVSDEDYLKSIEEKERAQAEAEAERLANADNPENKYKSKRGRGESDRYNKEQDADKESEVVMISLTDASVKEKSASVGDYLREELPPLNIDRLAAQVAKNVIVSKVKEVEREKQYEEFKDKVGEVIQGVVDKIEFGNVMLKLGSADAVLRRDATLRSDHFRVGDRVKALLSEIDRSARGSQIILSRTDKDFVAKLFEQEVPEIYEKTIEIMGIARDPGSRTKIAVYSSDSSIDPVGSCVGIRGSRVKAVIDELKGEKIDIMQWSDDTAKFVINALHPIDALKIIIDERGDKVGVVVNNEQQSAAIGRRGQNVKLIADLIGADVVIMTEEREIERRQEELSSVKSHLIEALDLDDMLAQVLAFEGYTNVCDIANASVEKLMKIEWIDEEVAKELIERAGEFQKNAKQLMIEKLDLTEDLVQLLIDFGYSDPKKLATTNKEHLMQIEGIEEEIAMELIDRAMEYTKNIELSSSDDLEESGGDEESEGHEDGDNQERKKDRSLSSFVAPDIVALLKEAEITKVEEVAEMDLLELQEILATKGYSSESKAVGNIIMIARSIAWGEK